MRNHTYDYRDGTIAIMAVGSIVAASLAGVLWKRPYLAANAEILTPSKPEPKAETSVTTVPKSDCSLLTVEQLKTTPASGLTKGERAYIDRCIGKARMNFMFAPN